MAYINPPMQWDALSRGKQQAILWAKSKGYDWRYVSGSTIEVHFPGDDYEGWDRSQENGHDVYTWGKCPSYRTIYDETYGDCYEFTPPAFG